MSTPNIPLQPVESSQISQLGYDEATLTCRVQFASRKADQAGAVYDYFGVSKEQYDALVNAESIGSHHHNHFKIKNPDGTLKFDYRRVPDSELQRPDATA